MLHNPISTAKVLITGAFASKGSFTNDKGEKVQYDHINFYTQMPLVKGKGFATAENKLKNRSNDFDKLFGSVQLPALADVSYIEQTDGKGKFIREITDIVFVKDKDNKVGV